MLDKTFENKFPFVYFYFSNLLEFVIKNQREFPQSLIFEGADTEMQYLFALELARILNCSKNRDLFCDCINCKWIKNHSHPAINNVSQIHFKGENDETKTVISAKQAREIEKSLALSSDYHRFFIFFSSREKVYKEDELNMFNQLEYNSNIDFSIEPLNYSTFHTTTPNALLKSIEEPPKRTTFVFLTKSKEDILPTIVSRSLVFKLSGKREKLEYKEILPLLNSYFSLDYKNALSVSDEFIKIIKEENLPQELVLNKILEFLKDVLKQNIQNERLVLKINTDIKLVSEAIKHTKANMSDKLVFETLFLRIVRGY